MSDIRSIQSTQFFHRLNADSTFESICGLCFLTVAKTADKETLQPTEAAHNCPKAGPANVIPFVDRRKRG
jgi:hypothetical protein